MNNGDENVRNTRRPSAHDITSNSPSATPTAGPSRITPVPFTILKREMPSPDATGNWSRRESGDYNNDMNESMFESENGNEDINLEDEDHNVNGNLTVANDEIEEDEECYADKAGNHNKTGEESTIIIPGRTLQTNESSTSTPSGATNSTVSKKKKKKRGEIILLKTKAVKL